MALTKIPASFLDKSSHVDFADSEEIRLGTGNDLRIFHAGTENFIRGNATESPLYIDVCQNLHIRHLDTDGGNAETMIKGIGDGAVELYHNNGKKFETSATGASVTGNLAVTGDLDITGNVNSASVTDLDVTDKTITLGAGQTEALSGGSGIIIDGSSASILWDETNTEFDINSNLKVATDTTLSFASDTVNSITLGTSGTNKPCIKFDTADTTHTNRVWAIENGAGGRLNFFRNGLDVLKLNQDGSVEIPGNVGIGAPIPETSLHIKNAGNSFLTLERSGTTGGTGKFGINMEGGSSQQTTMAYDDGGQLVIGRSSDPATMAGFSNDFILDSSGILTTAGGLKTTQTAALALELNGTYSGGNYIAWKKGGAAEFYIGSSETVGSGSGHYDLYAVAGKGLRFFTGAGERMRIDSSGHVGIGTTAKNNNYPARFLTTSLETPASGGEACHILELVGRRTANQGNQNGMIQFWNKTSTATETARISSIQGTAVNSGSLTFATYAAGTYAEAMIIYQNGHVGIGTMYPQAKFDVTVGNAKTANAGVWGYLGKTNESSNYQALQCFQIGGSAADERRYEFQTIEQGVSNDGIICLQKSGGRVFIGHDSADGNTDKLSISGSIGISNDGYIGAGSGFGPSNGAGSSGTIQLYSSSTGNMTFATNYSSGDEVHNMSGNTKFVVKRSAAGTSAVQFYTLDGGYQVGALNSGYFHTMRISGPSTYYFDNACQASGGFSTYSDEKLKEEITTITGALDKVAVMNGVTFKWKDAAKRGSGDTGKQFGVIAQNMLEVDSELPTLNVDPLETNENIEDNSKDTDYYTMDYSRLTPYFIEAIKELKTKLEAAEARIATLEG